MNSRFTVLVSVKTRKGVVIQHHYFLEAYAQGSARKKAMRKAWWRFPFCGIVIAEVTYGW